MYRVYILNKAVRCSLLAVCGTARHNFLFGSVSAQPDLDGRLPKIQQSGLTLRGHLSLVRPHKRLFRHLPLSILTPIQTPTISWLGNHAANFSRAFNENQENHVKAHEATINALIERIQAMPLGLKFREPRVLRGKVKSVRSPPTKRGVPFGFNGTPLSLILTNSCTSPAISRMPCLLNDWDGLLDDFCSHSLRGSLNFSWTWSATNPSRSTISTNA